MSKLYIIILVPVIVAVLLVLFTGMDKMNTDEKGDEATDDGRKTYHWSPAISVPRKWPVEVFQADFILDKPEQEDTNVRVRSYFGPDFQCGGMGIEKKVLRSMRIIGWCFRAISKHWIINPKLYKNYLAKERVINSTGVK